MKEKQLILENPAEFIKRWVDMLTDKRLSLILLRHGSKPTDGGRMCGLSERGIKEVSLVAQLTSPLLAELYYTQRLGRIFSSGPERNDQTLQILIPLDVDRKEFERPKSLEVPFMGPNDEDLATARALGKEVGITTKEAYYVLEKHAKLRLGEHPMGARLRIKAALTGAMEKDKVAIYCGNAPVMNDALGVEGTTGEVSALFFHFNGHGEFELIGIIEPEFVEE